MAESVGGKIRNFMVAILVGLLVVAFAVWGVNDVFTARAGNAVITVGDAEITSSEFEDAFERELQTINRDNESSVTNQQAYAQGLHNRVLQNLLTDTVIGIDADELGVGVNRSVARNVVKEIPSFQNALTGEFRVANLRTISFAHSAASKQSLPLLAAFKHQLNMRPSVTTSSQNSAKRMSSHLQPTPCPPPRTPQMIN